MCSESTVDFAVVLSSSEESSSGVYHVLDAPLVMLKSLVASTLAKRQMIT